MKDFKSYSQENPKPDGDKNANAGGPGGSENVNNTVNMAAMLAKAFNGKSEKDIWQTILAQAEQGKRDGTLTNADLDNFYNAVAPLVDGFKRQKLKSVILKLKQI